MRWPEKTWSRAELVELLGEPEDDYWQVTHSEVTAEGQVITPRRVDGPVPGALRILRWRCAQIPPSGEHDAEFKAWREPIGRPGPTCVAMTRFEYDDVWALRHVCLRHSLEGLAGSLGWPPPL